MPSKPSTFAYLVLRKILPDYIDITKPLDKSETEKILKTIYAKEPDKYSYYVNELKKFGDKVATLEGITIGIKEISTDTKHEIR